MIRRLIARWLAQEIRRELIRGNRQTNHLLSLGLIRDQGKELAEHKQRGRLIP